MWIGNETALRAAAAAKLSKESPNSSLIMSGGLAVVPGSPTEAVAMADYVIHEPWNISKEKVLVESESFETAGNVRNVVRMLRTHSLLPARLTLLTGKKNASRALAYFRAHGLEVHWKNPREVLGDASPEHIILIDRLHERVLRILQLFDPRGNLATSIRRWQLRKQRSESKVS